MERTEVEMGIFRTKEKKKKAFSFHTERIETEKEANKEWMNEMCQA